MCYNEIESIDAFGFHAFAYRIGFLVGTEYDGVCVRQEGWECSFHIQLGDSIVVMLNHNFTTCKSRICLLYTCDLSTEENSLPVYNFIFLPFFSCFLFSSFFFLLDLVY